jgi:hypothetical protein
MHTSFVFIQRGYKTNTSLQKINRNWNITILSEWHGQPTYLNFGRIVPSNSVRPVAGYLLTVKTICHRRSTSTCIPHLMKRTVIYYSLVRKLDNSHSTDRDNQHGCNPCTRGNRKTEILANGNSWQYWGNQRLNCEKRSARTLPPFPSPHPSLNYSVQGSAGTVFWRVPAQLNPWRYQLHCKGNFRIFWVW